MASVYYIHANGDRPFKVVVDDLSVNVNIYKRVRNTESVYESVPYKSFECANVFIGQDPNNQSIETIGNTILLQLSNCQYVFIGGCIKMFQTSNTIVEYVSPIGNSDVPYPYAIDDMDNYYLLIEDVVISGRQIIGDIYGYYYRNGLITPDRGCVPPQTPIIEHFQNIVVFFIDDRQWTLTYKPNALFEYDDILRRLDGNHMYVEKLDGKRYLLTQDDYVKLMKDFGDMNSFSLIKDIDK